MFTSKKEKAKATSAIDATTSSSVASSPPVKQDEDELDRLARKTLLEEAKRNKIRAETHGALGWLKPTLVTNRTFLNNTLISNAVHNTYRNQQQYMRGSNRFSSRKETTRREDEFKRKRSRTPSPRRKRYDNDDSPPRSTSKRTKKDKR